MKLRENMKKFINKKNLLTVYVLILFLSIIYNGIFKPYLMYSSYYTLGIVGFPFNEMIQATSSDVHPPLYYIFLKGFLKLFNPTNDILRIQLAKIISIIPIGLILIINFTKVKKEFGYLVALIFSILICSSFQLMNYAITLRMYSWALFFLTLEFISFWEVCKSNNKFYWLLLTVSTLCACYTHYFAAITSIIIYLLLLKQTNLKYWLTSAGICIIGYAGWVSVLISQISSVNGGYWIKTITLESIGECFQFILASGNNLLGDVLGVCLLIVILVLTYFGFKLKDDKSKYSLKIMSVILLTLIVGVVLSYTIQPILIPRYLIPSAAGLWLGVAILVQKLERINKKLFYTVIGIILIISLVSLANFYVESDKRHEKTLKELDFLESLNNGSLVVFNDPLSQTRYSPYLNKDTILFSWNLTSEIITHDKENLIVFAKFDDVDKNNYFDLNRLGVINQDNVYLKPAI